MQNYYDYKKFAILYVDDEEKSLKMLTKYFEGTFRFFTATNAQEAYQILEANKDHIGILMTDQRMPGEKGVWLLEKARQNFPRVVRLLVTAYADIDAAVQAVNSGAIYKYVSKPWDLPSLEANLRRGMEFFIVQRERDQLLREKMTVLHNMVITDRVITLGILASGLGHYVRNSLVAVQTFLDLAPVKLKQEILDLEQMRNPNFWKDFYTHVQDQVKRITRMLDDLGSATQSKSLVFDQKVQLRSVVQQVLDKMQFPANEKKIVFANEIPSDLPEICVDGLRFMRLFELLFEDEIACLPPGSQVSIQAAPVPNKSGEDAEIEINITDNGPGLPQDALRAVFDPFFVRHDDPQNFGISLMACYFVIYHHGGTIKVTSADDKGTSFIINLPVNPQRRGQSLNEADFLAKVFMNDTLWDRLLSGV